jgi:hypothetical protein
VLAGNATLDLAGVDLGAITNDLHVQYGGHAVTRDLGASASIQCDGTTGCMP